MQMKMMKNMTPDMMKDKTKEQIAMMMPKMEDMPGPFCSIGTSICKNLDYTQMCMCATYQVFKDFNLMNGKPMSYFCKTEKAT
jgi:hypothetical protein